jgi:hypothetical protein
VSNITGQRGEARLVASCTFPMRSAADAFATILQRDATVVFSSSSLGPCVRFTALHTAYVHPEAAATAAAAAAADGRSDAVRASMALPQLPTVLLDDPAFVAQLPITMRPWVASHAGVAATAVTVSPPSIPHPGQLPQITLEVLFPPSDTTSGTAEALAATLRTAPTRLLAGSVLQPHAMYTLEPQWVTTTRAQTYAVASSAWFPLLSPAAAATQHFQTALRETFAAARGVAPVQVVLRSVEAAPPGLTGTELSFAVLYPPAAVAAAHTAAAELEASSALTQLISVPLGTLQYRTFWGLTGRVEPTRDPEGWGLPAPPLAAVAPTVKAQVVLTSTNINVPLNDTASVLANDLRTAIAAVSGLHTDAVPRLTKHDLSSTPPPAQSDRYTLPCGARQHALRCWWTPWCCPRVRRDAHAWSWWPPSSPRRSSRKRSAPQQRRRW